MFRLYVDESGDHAYVPNALPQNKYLGLLGMMIDIEYYTTKFQPDLEEFKNKVFSPDPDEPIVLHRSDIINRKGIFSKLRDKNVLKTFNDGLLDFLGSHDFTLICVVLNKESHVGTYGNRARHPYHYCLSALMERYCYTLRRLGNRGDILAESRGGAEDRTLKAVYRQVYKDGTYFLNSEVASQVLTSKELKLKPKAANIAGLQVADLLAYCCKNSIASLNNSTFSRLICECIKNKYDCSPNGIITGFGKVLL